MISMNNWYDELSDQEIKKLKDGLANRMLLKSADQEAAVWNALLEEKYNEFMRYSARREEVQLAEKEAQSKADEQRRSDLSRGIFTLELYTSGKYKAWVAEITGLDNKFGLSRSFINPFEVKGNTKIYQLTEGRYYNYLVRGEQHFVQVVNADLIEYDKNEMFEIAKNISPV